ncbi:hypothetical protein ABVK25_001525 [Lepraria finkii]|uniref:Uncharacterized protein n=1 Tax=Lepraria finkii TaxID=1340010 RepID=A0ABR4BPJ5_9LECA
MANGGEPIDTEEIVKARRHAKSRPSMREIALGKTEAAIPDQFSIAKLILANFTVEVVFCLCFDPAKLQEVEFRWFKLARDLLRRIEALGLRRTKVTILESEYLV